jgi:hypothetical protein
MFIELLLSNGHGAHPHKKHLLQHLFYCCVCVCCLAMGLLYCWLRACLPSRCLAMGICVTLLLSYIIHIRFVLQRINYFVQYCLHFFLLPLCLITDILKLQWKSPPSNCGPHWTRFSHLRFVSASTHNPLCARPPPPRLPPFPQTSCRSGHARTLEFHTWSLLLQFFTRPWYLNGRARSGTCFTPQCCQPCPDKVKVLPTIQGNLQIVYYFTRVCNVSTNCKVGNNGKEVDNYLSSL